MNILFVVHNYIGVGRHYGGTELHVKDIVEQFQKVEEHHVWILCPKFGRGIRAYYLFDTKNDTREEFDINYPVSWECYRHDDFNSKIVPLLQKNRIDLVHFFHLIHFPLSFPLVVQQAGARVIVSFFDYYLVCRKFNLLTDNDSRFCGYPNVCASTCDICLRKSFGYAPGTQMNRRKLISEILYHADAVHYLCSDVRERVLATYSHLKHKPELVTGLGMKEEYLTQAKPEHKALAAEEQIHGKPLRIACLGNFAPHKGSDLILSVMEHYSALSAGAKALGQEAPVHFHLYGASQHSEDRKLGFYIKKGLVTVHGKYKPEELPTLLADCDAALFTSIWPETFALVLSEVWACNIVPIAPRLGAFGERITHGVTGMLFDVVNDPGSVIDAINELIVSPDSITRMRAAISQLVPLTLQDNQRDYNRFYKEVMERESRPHESVAQVYLPERLHDWHLVATNVGGVASPPPPPPQARNKILVQRAWGVLRRRGLKHTLQASLDYLHLKRG